MIALQVAAHLETVTAVKAAGYDYNEAATGGNVFIDHHPDKPDLSVAIMTQPGREPEDAGYGYDRPEVQFLVRGAATAAGRQAAHDLAAAIRAALAGRHSFALPDGTVVVKATATQSGPTPIGTDDAGRPEYSVIVEVEVVQATTHRPLG